MKSAETMAVVQFALHDDNERRHAQHLNTKQAETKTRQQHVLKMVQKTAM